MIQLIGPGGTGKTTAGLALASRLGVPFIDLDEQFRVRLGEIAHYLNVHGYPSYARQNIQVYVDTLGTFSEDAVLALSSGFMTYRSDAHPAYGSICRDMVANPLTVVLLPSFDCETCVAETVRRQLSRPFSRSAQREEQVIRARFEVYAGLPAKKFETTMRIEFLVDQLVTHLLPHIRLRPTAAGAIMGHRG
jgi:shikimate kinase